MTVYINGTPSSPDLYFADVAFIAGNPARSDPPKFEHVALIGWPARPATAEDWSAVKVYGLPESTPEEDDDNDDDEADEMKAKIKDAESQGLRLRETRYWKDKTALTAILPPHTVPLLGLPKSAWNLIMRAKLDKSEAEFRMYQAAFATGCNRYAYGDHFDVREKEGVRHTNCLGFVVDFLTRPVSSQNRPPLTPDPFLVAEFDEEYTVPFQKPRTRRCPSIGHLVQALLLPARTQAYGHGISRAEAEATALAKAFLLGQAAPPAA